VGEGATRIFVCDDSAGFAALIAAWCDAVDGVEVSGRAASGEELLSLLPGAAADVLLLDLMLPEGPSSPELVASVRASKPGIRVILMSSMPEDDLAVEAKRVQADAYSSKLTTVDKLLAVVTDGST
jgi:DNA-binding NarL/FixJ family response regulator